MINAIEARQIELSSKKDRKKLAKKYFKKHAKSTIREAAYRGKTFARVKAEGIDKADGINFFKKLGYNVQVLGCSGTFDSYTFFKVTWDHIMIRHTKKVSLA